MQAYRGFAIVEDGKAKRAAEVILGHHTKTTDQRSQQTHGTCAKSDEGKMEMDQSEYVTNRWWLGLLLGGPAGNSPSCVAGHDHSSFAANVRARKPALSVRCGWVVLTHGGSMIGGKKQFLPRNPSAYLQPYRLVLISSLPMAIPPTLRYKQNVPTVLIERSECSVGGF